MAANTMRHGDENPDQVRERQKRRREQETLQIGDVISARRKKLRILLGHACRYCGEPLSAEYEVDHLTPISRGGTNRDGNLTLACQKCNRAKGAKTLTEYEEWRRERGLAVRQIFVEGEHPDEAQSNVLRNRY